MKQVSRINKVEKESTHKKSLTLKQRQAIAGIVFISPFILGFLLIFVVPLIRSIVIAFSELTVGKAGYTLEFIGIEHFYNLFFIDPNFRRTIFSTIGRMIGSVPVILLFSFFMAFLISKNFKGRTLARAILFLPVILTAGVMVAEDSVNLMGITTQAALENIDTFNFSNGISAMLQQFKIDPIFVTYITSLVDELYNIISGCGVQMLIFLIGIQSISPSLYEASTMEGATGWENFWKITFPMVTPLILVNTIYSIIDSFTRTNGDLLGVITKTGFSEGNYGLSAAMSIIYIVVVISFIFIVSKVINKFTFYYD